MPRPIVTPSVLRWKKVPRSGRRQAIQRGWDQFQLSGWAEDSPWPDEDPRTWLWQNGVEGAERAKKDPGFRIEMVQGWK